MSSRNDLVRRHKLDWDSIHRAVQEILETLTGWVFARAPATGWKLGRSSARAFPLFSYRVFYRLDGNDYDPVIVGVTVSLEGSIARVSGDISGDESGRVYFDKGCNLEVPSHQRYLRRRLPRRVSPRRARADCP